MLNALHLLAACLLVSGGHALTNWVPITNVGQFTASSKGTNITYLHDEDGSLRIALSFNNYGCGKTPPNYFAALITDAAEDDTWDRIQYRMDFYGTTICYSIFGNTWYGGSPWSGEDNICGANGQSFGLFPFDMNIDLIENGLNIGDAWTGKSKHCGGNKTDNLWVGDGGGHRNHDGFVKVELRRRPFSNSSGLYVGSGCHVGGMIMDGIDTPVDAVFSEISVGYDYDDEQEMSHLVPQKLPQTLSWKTASFQARGYDVEEPTYYIVKVTAFDIWCFVVVFAVVCVAAAIGCKYRQRTPKSYGKVVQFTESDVENAVLK